MFNMNEIEGRLNDLKKKHNVHLTGAAQAILLNPIAEYKYLTEAWDKDLTSLFSLDNNNEAIIESLELVFLEMLKSPSEVDKLFEEEIDTLPNAQNLQRLANLGIEYPFDGRFRSATSVIKAIWQKFCSVPPFCTGSKNRMGYME